MNAIQREARLNCDSVYDSSSSKAKLAGLLCHSAPAKNTFC